MHGKKPLIEGFSEQAPKGLMFTMGILSQVVAAILPCIENRVLHVACN
jgi:hypothetical protein